MIDTSHLRPGDVFTCNTSLSLWDNPVTVQLPSRVVGHVKPHTLCIVLAMVFRYGMPGDAEYVVLSPSQEFGWCSLSQLSTRREIR